MPRPTWNQVCHSPWALLLVGGAIVSLLGGCGGTSEPFSYKKIKGSVKYDDGTLIPAFRIRVTFVPENMSTPLADGKTYPRPGNAELNVADGTFSNVTTHLPDDGVIPGKMKVQIIAEDKDEHVLAVVPPEYGDAAKTPLEVDTSASDDFQLKVKKPAGRAPGK